MISVIANELKLKMTQVENTIALLESGKTIPFIARYRKEATQSLDEVEIFRIQERYDYLRQLEERKIAIIKSIQEQNKLNDELRRQIDNCMILNELEDLYLPYKPKKRSRAQVAREKGLEPLAIQILGQKDALLSLKTEAEKYIDFEQDLFTSSDVLKGASDIIAEMISESAENRKEIRNFYFQTALLESEKKEANEQSDYVLYFDFREEIKRIPPHRILALFRGEREQELLLRFIVDVAVIESRMHARFIQSSNTEIRSFLEKAIHDSYKRLIEASIERELRQDLMEKAEEHAISVFGENLKHLLLQAPLPHRVILGIDPGFRTGSKCVVIDRTGKYCDHCSIFPHPPQNQKEEARRQLIELIQTYQVEVVAIGNGTASRETELWVAECIREAKLSVAYVIVNEAGASVYSASEVARDEFPDLDVTVRGAVSIARRLQDPLAELVKIDPKSIGVGLYQHDVDQKKLANSLDFIVDYCVNHVGLDINTASAALLEHVSGLNKRNARSIVAHRNKHGAFQDRFQLLKVSGIGEGSFEQAAGFLRIYDGTNFLDSTAIHPESYSIAQRMIQDYQLTDNCQFLALNASKLRNINPKKLSEQYQCGPETIQDIITQLSDSHRDPRDLASAPILRTDVLKYEDIQIGLQLKGTVRNVVDFGAFIDIGIKQDALLHISEMANRFVKNPNEIVKVGDIVSVKVIAKDDNRQRVSLSMKV